MSSKTSLDDNIKELTSLEQHYPVDEWEFKGIHIWPILRIRIGNQLIARQRRFKDSSTTRLNSPTSFLGRFIKRGTKTFQSLLGGVLDLQNSVVRRNKSDVICLTNNYFRTPLLHQYYDRILGPVLEYIEDIGMVAHTFEIAQNGFRYPRFNKTAIIDWMIILRSICADLCFYLSRRIIKSRWEHSEINSLVKDVYDRLNVDISNFEKELYRIQAYRKVFRRRIRKVKPHTAFCVNYPHTITFAFILACHDEGVITYELQHGVQGRSHLSYSQWTKVPTGGYNCMPRIFLVWSDADRANIEKWSSLPGIDNHEAVCVGNLFLQKWKDNESPIVQRYDLEMSNILTGYQASIKVLYSISNKLPSRFVTRFIKDNQNYLFWIRLHPNRQYMKKDLESMVRDLGLNNVYIDDASRLPLYAVLRNVDLHVTRYSSVVWEALEFGIPSIIVDKWGVDLFRHAISREFVSIALDSVSFERCMNLPPIQHKSNIDKTETHISTLNFDKIFSKFR